MPAAPAPIRLAYLLSQYPAVNHVFMLREVRLLRTLGFEIHVASIRDPDRPLAQMTAAEREEVAATYYVKSSGLRVVASAHLHTLVTRPVSYCRGLTEALRVGISAAPYFAEAVVIGRWMAAHKISHLHTHFASTVATMVARVFPVTFSMTVHGPAEFQDPIKSRLARKVEASLFVCAISQFGLSQIMYANEHAQWGKLERTMLGVDPSEFVPRPFRPNPEPFEIICVGRLAAVKGQHLLIEAIDALASQGRRVRLRLAGDGPDRGELEEDVRRRGIFGEVVFEGNVNQDRLKDLYRGSDVLVLSSFAEGLPVVLMEAMAMEIPCIAPWVNGIPEIITHGVDGLLVPPGSGQALTCAIARLIDDAELRRALGESARRKIVDKFNAQRNIEQLAEIFRRRLS